MFLESMLRRRDQFMQWVSSPEFLHSKFASMNEGKYAHSCLSSLSWWENMDQVVKSVAPLYAFLRFADSDKVPNLSEVLLRFHILRKEYENLFHDEPRELSRYMSVIEPRMGDISNDSYVNGGNTISSSLHFICSTHITYSYSNLPLFMYSCHA